MQKTLFDGEEIIRKWNNCTLTNKRVWRQVEMRGSSEYRGFPLVQFQGATIGKNTFPALLYIGCTFFLFALFCVTCSFRK